MGITAAVLSGLILAMVAPLVVKYLRGYAGWALAIVPAAIFLYFLSYLPGVTDGTTYTEFHAWVPDLDINLDFYLDGLSLTFALIISGIGALIFVYSGGYLKEHPELGRFYLILMIFMASMLGIVLSNNLITLFIFWELTTVSSYLLIGFDHNRRQARSAAMQALLTTGLGGIALLAGLLLLGQVGETYQISSLLGQGSLIRENNLYTAIALLVLLGAFTKSAQFPFHYWLPNAMEAPTPVSAYLHSATMVKAGIYLMARFTPVLGGSDIWKYTVTTGGAITMVLGAWLALEQTDFKRILAYTTLSILGLLTMLIGVDTDTALNAMLIYLVSHAFYKGALFMAAGAVDHETGTRDIEQLGGLRSAMPIITLAAGIAALSMAGVPPLLGFIAKETLYKSTWDAPDTAGALLAVSVAASLGLVISAIYTGYKPFFGLRIETLQTPHRAPPSLWLGPVVLAGLGLVLGLYPISIEPLVEAGVASMTPGEAVSVHIELWPGFNAILLLSLATVAAGVALYLILGNIRLFGERVNGMVGGLIGPDRIYRLSLGGLNGLARGVTGVLQNGYLRFYIITIVITTMLLAGIPLLLRDGIEEVLFDFSDIRFYEIGLLLLITTAALAAIHSRSRLASIAALGVVGYGISLIFILFGAPDLAMTQFMVETLTVILLVLVFYHLPGFSKLTSTSARARDVIIAVGFGALMTTLMLITLRLQYFSKVSDYFAGVSVESAFGYNIVNVILVDFRALDTLGEISVLVIAALGVYALLKLRIGDARE